MLKKNLEDYRQGAIGALMDEYVRAALELKSIVENVGEDEYTQIADTETTDEDCRSIQTIINHVVRAGYGYAKYIRESLSMDALPVENKQISKPEIGAEIDQMMAYTIETFAEHWETMDDKLETVFIKSRWGITYNIDQLLEHAIVHILRHRRQIDKFILKFQN